MPSAETKSHNIIAAQWTTAYVDSLPNSSFAWVDAKGGRHLPYKDKDGKVDLPHTRNALARLNQVAGLSGEEAAKVRTKLQNALKNAKAADDVAFQAWQAVTADDKQQLPSRMMLLRSGTFNTQKYGEIPLTASDLREMKTNFDNGVGMAGDGTTGIPVDFAHQSHLNAGAWIKGLEILDSQESPGQVELWASEIEWSKSGREAILGKEYKMLSADFYPSAFGEWVDPESGVVAQNVIVGAAFTNRPMFSGNQPVVASDTRGDEGKEINKTVYVIASQEKEKSMHNIDELRVKEPKDLTGEQYKFLAEHSAELSADEQTKFSLKAEVKAGGEGEGDGGEGGDNKQPIKASEVKGDEGNVVVEASELKKLVDGNQSLTASVEALEKDAKAREEAEVKGMVLAHVKRGAIKADRTDSWTQRILAAQGKDREEIIADLKAIPDNKLLAGEQGSGDGAEGDGTDPRTKFMSKVAEKVQAAAKTDKPLSWDEAKEEVRNEEPELAAQAADSGRERVAASAAVPTEDQLKAAGVNAG